MLLDLLFIIIGITLVLWGADKFTDGASALARRMKVPPIVIGLTVVAMGTSAPELFVSMASALKGSSGMALGNIVGSNIFNALAIVGCAALVAPIVITPGTVKKDIPFAIVASAALALLTLIDGRLDRIDALLLLAGFAVFMVYTLRLARSGNAQQETTGEAADAAPANLWKCLGLIVLGLACLIVGSNIFVNYASDVARQLGVSDAVVGPTIVACGTSLPELATSVVSARKGESAIAIGNAIGSNVFNILLILGLTGTICPMTLGGITWIDMAMMLGSIGLLWLFSFTKLRVQRWEGGVLVAIFLAYMTWLVVTA